MRERVDLDEVKIVLMAIIAERMHNNTNLLTHPLAAVSAIATTRSEKARFSGPPIFDYGRIKVTETQEKALITAYRNLSASKLIDSTLRLQLQICTERCPFVAEPFVWMALFSLSNDDIDICCRYASKAEEIFLSWQCAWDKRLSLEQWLSLSEYLQSIGQRTEIEVDRVRHAVTQLLIQPSLRPETIFLTLLSQVEPDTPADLFQHRDETQPLINFDKLPSRFSEYILNVTSSKQEALYPRLKTQPWWSSEHFALAAELDEVGSETVEFFRISPRELDARVARGPAVSRVRDCVSNIEVAAIPSLERVIARKQRSEHNLRHAWIATFPNTKTIYVDQYQRNTCLLLTFAIEVPQDCGITVGGITKRWKPASCLIIDPSYKHEVWNSGPGDLTFAVVELWHPELTVEEIGLLQGFDDYVSFKALQLRE